jgi:hypothetical protein
VLLASVTKKKEMFTLARCFDNCLTLTKVQISKKKKHFGAKPFHQLAASPTHQK